MLETSSTSDANTLRGYLKSISFDDIKTYARENIFFFLWILFVPLIMLSMKQGRELLNGLFDDTGRYPGFRAAAMLLVYFVQGLAIFLLPSALFAKAQEADLNRLRRLTTRNIYLSTSISMFPMVLYGVVMLGVQFSRNHNWIVLILSLLIIMAGGYGVYRMIKYGNFKLSTLLLMIIANLILTFSSLVLAPRISDKPDWNYLYVGLCMVLQVIIMSGILKHLFGQLHSKLYKTFYWVVFGLTMLTTFFFSRAENLHFQSPTFILLVITTFYIVLNDIVTALYILRGGKRFNRILTISLVLFGLFLFVYKSRIYNINYVNSTVTAADRVDFKTYFKAWYLQNIAPDMDTASTKTIPVYLMATQGGGSRAGIWTGLITNELEARDPDFSKHLFAVTSASGGSAGFGATLSLWRYLQERPTIPDTSRQKQLRCFSKGMFQRNYLSSSFMQLFINEIPKRFISLVKKDVTDRNYEQQKHEAIGFGDAIRQCIAGDQIIDASAGERLRALFRKGDADSLYMGKNTASIPNYPMLPYLSYWYQTSKKPDTRLPLYFPITTNIQTGKSGYCSPIAWDSTLFIDAIDIIADAEKGRSGKSLAMVTASCLSQLFPLMNAYTYIDGTGNFMDGGLFENMGLTLQNSLYQAIEKEVAGANYIPESVKKRLKVQMIFQVNAALEPDPADNAKRRNQGMATIEGIGFSSIAGTTTWWMKHFRTVKPGGITPIEFTLQTPMTDPKDRLPLGRWLSDRSVREAGKRAEAHQPQFKVILDALE